MGSVRVFGTRDKAVMYDGTTENAFGPVYRGHLNAERELSEFVNDWAPSDLQSYGNRTLGHLMTAYKVEKGWLDEADWPTQLEKAEEILGREVPSE